MTSVHTHKYIEEKNNLKRWILPQNGLNIGTQFAYSLIGQQPGLMPLDTHLFEDSHEMIDTYMHIFSSFHDNDPKKIPQEHHTPSLWRITASGIKLLVRMHPR